MTIARTIMMASFAAAALSYGVSQAHAGGRPCVGECYEKYVTPPVYGAVAEKVMVAPPRTISHVVPPKFAVVPETVTIRPEHVVAHRTPPQYATVAEQVMVSPGGKRWVVRRDYYGREIGCWEYEKPQYVTRHRTVVTHPGSVVYSRVPAVTAVREREVMVRPPSIAHETIPAQYAVRERTVLVRPATAGWRPVGHHRSY